MLESVKTVTDRQRKLRECENCDRETERYCSKSVKTVNKRWKGCESAETVTDRWRGCESVKTMTDIWRGCESVNTVTERRRDGDFAIM